MKLFLYNTSGVSMEVAKQGGPKIEFIHKFSKINHVDIVILTETKISQNNIQSLHIPGFKTIAESARDNAAGGVVLLARDTISVIPESIRQSTDPGKFAACVVIHNGQRVILIGVYGVSENDDARAIDVFKNLTESVEELSEIYATGRMIIGGDFNLITRASDSTSGIIHKKRAGLILTDLVRDWNLKDAAIVRGDNRHTYFKRTNRIPYSARLDRVYFSENIRITSYKTFASFTDHNVVIVEFEHKIVKKAITVKDSILRNCEFIDEAMNVIKDTLITNSVQGANGISDDLRRMIEEPTRRADEFENLLQYTDTTEGVDDLSVLNLIMLKLKLLHDKLYRAKRREASERLQNLSDAVARLNQELHGTAYGSQEYDALMLDVQEARGQLKREIETQRMARQTRIKNFYHSKKGKLNSTSFQILRQPRSSKVIKELHLPERVVRDQDEIGEIVAQHYINLVTNQFSQRTSVADFIDAYRVQLPELNEDIRDELIQEVTEEELRGIIKKLKPVSAPGPSGISGNMIKFAFKNIPQLFTRALNQYIFVPGRCDSMSLRWWKKRTVIFVPKPGKPKTDISAYRPISLLEIIFKVATKVIADRINKHSSAFLHPGQSGFRNGRGCQYPITTACHVLEDATKHAKSLTVCSFDVSRAFDSLQPIVVTQTMRIMNFPNIIIEALDSLCALGMGTIVANDFRSEEIQIVGAAAQGEPSSAIRFNIGSEPINVVMREHFADRQYTDELGRTYPPELLADDRIAFTTISSLAEFTEYIQPMIDYYEVSGLKNNLSKTSIMVINQEQEFQEDIIHAELGAIVPSFRYLGIILSDSVQNIIEETKEHIVGKMLHKLEIMNRYNVDMLHRTLMFRMGFIPMIHHVFLSLPSEAAAIEMVEKRIQELLWTRTKEGIRKKGRILISKKRTHCSYELGGLQLPRLHDVDTALKLNNIVRIYKMMYEEDRENWPMAIHILEDILLITGSPSVRDLVEKCGSYIWKKTADKMRRYSKYYSQIFEAGSMLLHLLEKDKRYLMQTAVNGHEYLSPFHLLPDECVQLENERIFIVSQLFAIRENQMINIRENTIQNMALSNSLKTKLINLCNRIRNMDPEETTLVHRSFLALLIMSGRKISWIYRKIRQEMIDQEQEMPPSYYTRIRDGQTVPTKEDYKLAYASVVRTKDISSKARDIGLQVLNRTLWTNLKANLSRMMSMVQGEVEGEVVPSVCSLCQEIENTDHIVASCPNYSEKIWDYIENVINGYMADKGRNQRVVLRSIHIMYNKKIQFMRKTDADDCMLLFHEVKREIYYRRMNRTGGMIDNRRILMHLLLLIQRLVSLKKYLGKKSDLLFYAERNLVERIQAM